MQPEPHQLTTDQWDLSGHRVFISSRRVWLEVMSRPMLLTCSSVVCMMLCIRMRSLNYCTVFWSQVEASKEAEKAEVVEKESRPQSIFISRWCRHATWTTSAHHRPVRLVRSPGVHQQPAGVAGGDVQAPVPNLQQCCNHDAVYTDEIT